MKSLFLSIRLIVYEFDELIPKLINLPDPEYNQYLNYFCQLLFVLPFQKILYFIFL